VTLLPRVLRLALSIAALVLVPGAALALELVPRGADWKFLDDGSSPAASWIDAGFDDGAWATGRAQLGYGDADEDTLVANGLPNPLNEKFITTYFRHAFTVADPGALQGLTLHLLRDDGAVVYLNGSEVYRTNLPAGPIDFQTLASTAIDGANEDALLEVALDPAGVVAGTNLIAVEIHQVSATSSDISFDLALSTAPPALLRGPYLQVGSPDALVVRWRTDLATDSRVRFGPAPDQLTTSVSVPGLRTEHEVALSGLAASTRYFYDVGATGLTLAGGDAEHSFLTAPPSGTRGLFRIWAIGDSGECAMSAQGCADASAVANAYLAIAAGHPADVWLMLGDNAYTLGTENQYTKAVFDTYPNILRNTVLWPSPGNHEFGASDSPTQTGPYYEAFSMPSAGQAGGVPSGTEAYYSFDYGNVHFVALDSHDTSRAAPADPTANVCPPGQGGAMYQWLCADLQATDKEWLIAYWHHPPYTKGSHDSDNPLDSGARMQEMRERFLPVLESYGVDLMLSGHSHSYERSMLIDGHYGLSSSFGPEHVVDGGDGDPAGSGPYVKLSPGLAPHEGTVYSVVGSSSKNSGGLTQHPIMTVYVNYEGSLVVDVEGARLDGYWIDKDGLLGDHFQIVKGPTNIPALSSTWTAIAATAFLVVGLLALGRMRRARAPARGA